MVLTLYKMDVSPPVRAVYMTIEALKIPNVKYVELNLLADEHLKEDFLKINPQHTIPHLTDGNLNVWDRLFQLNDSIMKWIVMKPLDDINWNVHAIITYLVNKYGKGSSLYPTDPDKRALIDLKLHFDSGILYPALRLNDEDIFFGTSTTFTPEGIAKIKSGYDFMETFLKGVEWLVGEEPTLADISCVATVSSLHYLYAIDEKLYPNITAWIERCSKLDYYKKGNIPGLLGYGQILKQYLARKF